LSGGSFGFGLQKRLSDLEKSRRLALRIVWRIAERRYSEETESSAGQGQRD
jgi:hypothetical protein